MKYSDLLNSHLKYETTNEKNEYRHKIRNEVVPKIIVELFKK